MVSLVGGKVPLKLTFMEVCAMANAVVTRNGKAQSVAQDPRAAYEAWVATHPDASKPQRQAIADYLGYEIPEDRTLSAEVRDSGALAIKRGGKQVGSHYVATWETLLREFADPQFVAFLVAAIAEARK